MKMFKVAEYWEYSYVTNCVSSTAEKIDAMLEHPSNEEISYDEFIDLVSEEQMKELFTIYDWEGEGGLELKDDWAVSYYKSEFEGMKCVYMVHSAIEYVFCKHMG